MDPTRVVPAAAPAGDDDRAIDELWRWFHAHAADFGPTLENALVSELDRRVQALGPFAWELGPGRSQPHAFTISPGGDRVLLARTRAIVAAAPPLEGWEFHAAKPPKEWELRFELDDVDGNRVSMDATTWRYCLVRYPDGVHEVVIEAPELESLPAETRQHAGEIVLDGQLGEAVRIECVDAVTVVARLDEQERTRARPIAEIAKAFRRPEDRE